MAGPAQLLTATICVIALSLAAAACTNNEDDLGVLVDPAPGSTSPTTTTSTAAPTTTTTKPTTTTLSEQAQAEAEVAQLVTDYWLTEIDTAQGEVGLGFMTGLIEARTREWATGLTESGQTLRDLEGQKRIAIISVQVDLQTGRGEVEACMGSGSEVLDLETLERIEIGADPNFLSTSLLLVEETAEGWKINEMFPSAATGTPELCEVDT